MGYLKKQIPTIILIFDCMLGGIMTTQCEIDTYINDRLDDQIEW